MISSEPARERAFTTERVIDVSPDQVIEAFSSPALLAQWWGPNGFTNTFHEFDFKPGGVWRLDMHGSDGTVYPNKSVFEEITPERIVIRHLETVHAFTLAISLAQTAGGGTKVTWNQEFDSVEECERVRPYVPRCNEENLDRLEAVLASRKSPPSRPDVARES